MKNSPPQKKGDAPSAGAPPDESQNQSPGAALAVVTEVLSPESDLPKSETGCRFEVAPHNRYHRNAMLSAAQSACWIVLAGAELQRKKKEIGHGGWAAWVEENCEYSERTARNYMALADAVKSKALKGAKSDPASFLLLLSKSGDDLTPEEQMTLLQSVHKLTDGESVKQLYLDYGIIKKPQGSGAKGGDTSNGSKAPYDPNAAVEEARDLLLHPLREIARLWHEKSDGSELWTHLPDAEREEIAGIFLDLGNDLKAARAEKKTVKKGGAK